MKKVLSEIQWGLLGFIWAMAAVIIVLYSFLPVIVASATALGIGLSLGLIANPYSRYIWVKWLVIMGGIASFALGIQAVYIVPVDAYISFMKYGMFSLGLVIPFVLLSSAARKTYSSV